jgi:hypothetical protein
MDVVLEDLNKKMVFISGPRQTGKTTLAKILAENAHSHYYNWDNDRDRMAIKKNEIDADAEFLIFDEIHKNRSWRNWIKGLFDTYKAEKRILVTGSARLDIYRFGGDSLQGRYYSHRLHPVTYSELKGFETFDYSEFFKLKKKVELSKDLKKMCELGGFPEPLLSGSLREAKRWRLSYGSRIVKDDIRDLESLHDLSKVELLLHRLPATVGSVLSINSLREDLEVSFPTAKKWVEVLEKVYTVFRILPFGPAKIKAVKKEPKLYFWDWSQIEDEAARFENLIAVHLLRFVHWMEDVEGEKYELRFFKSTLDHEVDFIILKDKKPICAIEVKLDDRPLDSNLKYFLERIKVPYAFQVSLDGVKNFSPESINGCKIRICPAELLLANLP